MGGGGEDGIFEVPLGAGLKYRSMPVGCENFFAMASSSVVGAEDRSELSPADMMEGLSGGGCGQRYRLRCEIWGK